MRNFVDYKWAFYFQKRRGEDLGLPNTAAPSLPHVGAILRIHFHRRWNQEVVLQSSAGIGQGKGWIAWIQMNKLKRKKKNEILGLEFGGSSRGHFRAQVSRHLSGWTGYWAGIFFLQHFKISNFFFFFFLWIFNFRLVWVAADMVIRRLAIFLKFTVFSNLRLKPE